MIEKIFIKRFKAIKNQKINFLVDKKNIKDEDKTNSIYQINNKYYMKNLVFTGRNASGKSSVLEAINLALYFSNLGNIKLFLKEIAKIIFLKNYYHSILEESDDRKFNLKIIDDNIFKFKTSIKIEWKALNDTYYDFYFYDGNITLKINESKIDFKEFIHFLKIREKDILEAQNLNYRRFFIDGDFHKKINKIIIEYLEYKNINNDLIRANNFHTASGFNIINLLLKNDSNFNKKSVNKDNINLTQLNKKEILFIKKTIEAIDPNVDCVTEKLTTFEIKLISNIDIRFKDLSFGTKKIIKWLIKILVLFKKGGYFIIDEIENGLNFSLIYLIIKIFNNLEINKKNATIIFSTHFPFIIESLKFINESKMIFDSTAKKFLSVNEFKNLRTEEKENIFKTKNYYNDYLLASKNITPFSTISNKEIVNLIDDIEEIFERENE